MNTKPRTILILAGLFLAGAASGALLALRLAPRGNDRASERRSFTDRNLERMDRAVTFTPEQRPRVEALVRGTGEELAKMRRESWRVGALQIRALNTAIEALLTPEQKTKFAAYQLEQSERMRRRQTERDQRNRARHEGQSAPGEPPPEPPPEPAPEGLPPPPPN